MNRWHKLAGVIGLVICLMVGGNAQAPAPSYRYLSKDGQVLIVGPKRCVLVNVDTKQLLIWDDPVVTDDGEWLSVARKGKPGIGVRRARRLEDGRWEWAGELHDGKKHTKILLVGR